MRADGCVFLAAVTASGLCLADTVTLTNGDALSGQIVERTDAQVVLDHAVLGRLTLPAGQVASVTSEQEAPPAVAAQVTGRSAGATETPPTPAAEQPAGTVAPAAAAVAQEPAPPPPGWFGTSLFRGWKTTLAAGFSGAAGNSVNQSVNAQFKMTYEDADDRIAWDNTYFLKNEGDTRSQNEFKSELVRDWLIPDSKWFYFANAAYQYDDLESWQHRTSGFGGVGYTWVKNDDFEFLTRFGAGLTYEFGEVQELTPEALIGAVVVKWKIADNQTLSASNTLIPSFSHLGEYRNTSSLEWKLAVDKDSGMSVKLGLENEYESEPEGDDRHNDLKYYGAIVWDF